MLNEDFSWADYRALEGFVEEFTDILSENNLIGDRLPHISAALERRVARMVDIIEWT